MNLPNQAIGWLPFCSVEKCIDIQLFEENCHVRMELLDQILKDKKLLVHIDWIDVLGDVAVFGHQAV